jgi:hypothetical protein
LKDGALEKLVTYYPSHDFVIDRDEARELFRRVREPTTDEAELLKYLEPILALPGNQSRFIYLDELLATAWETDEEAGGDVGGAEPAGAAGEGRPEADADESRGSS